MDRPWLPTKTGSGLSKEASNQGVGPHRTSMLRRAYLNGRLTAYLTALLEARAAGLTAPPQIRSRSRRVTYTGAAIIRALRDAHKDNAAYRKRAVPHTRSRSRQ